jgi:uncharacterized protein YeaO (DUF488 family)
MHILLKRVYEERGPRDGTRVLVDRLWPRGIRKDKAGIDLWLKEIAPSEELRKWFGHDPDKWEEFQKRYCRELDTKGAEEVGTLQEILEKGRVTLVFAAKNERFNNAVALKSYLEGRSSHR